MVAESGTVRDCKSEGHELGQWTTSGKTTCRWCGHIVLPLRAADYPVLEKMWRDDA